MKVWVVACEGLVGKAMMRLLSEKKIPFVGSTHQEADILDFERCALFFDRHAPTHIVNCAAYVDVDKAEKEKEKAYALNVTGVEHLARLAKERTSRLIHISTDYVFDGMSTGDYREEDPVHPINVYGLSKLEGEKRLFEIYPEALSVRTSSVYGVDKKGLITYLIESLMEREELRLFSEQRSTPTYAKDLVGALFALRDESGIYHFTERGNASRLEIGEEVGRLLLKMGVPIACKRFIAVPQSEDKRIARRPPRSVLAIDKIAPLLHEPIRSWQEALEEYMEESMKGIQCC